MSQENGDQSADAQQRNHRCKTAARAHSWEKKRSLLRMQFFLCYKMQYYLVYIRAVTTKKKKTNESADYFLN